MLLFGWDDKNNKKQEDGWCRTALNTFMLVVEDWKKKLCVCCWNFFLDGESKDRCKIRLSMKPFFSPKKWRYLEHDEFLYLLLSNNHNFKGPAQTEECGNCIFGFLSTISSDWSKQNIFFPFLCRFGSCP